MHAHRSSARQQRGVVSFARQGDIERRRHHERRVVAHRLYVQQERETQRQLLDFVRDAATRVPIET